MLTFWVNLSAKVWLEIRRLGCEAIAYLASYKPTSPLRKTRLIKCHACACPTEPVCSASGSLKYVRCPQCGLVKFNVLTARHEHHPKVAQGIISLEQRRNTRKH